MGSVSSRGVGWAVVLALAACGAAAPADASSVDSAVDTGAADPDPDAGDAAPDPGLPFVTELADAEALGALALDDAGLEPVKYLVPVQGASHASLSEACYFQNMRRFPWHLQFLRSFPEYAGLTYDGYIALVLRPATRVLWGGSVQAWPHTQHPVSSELGVVSYTVYAEQDTLEVTDIVAVDAALKACMPFAVQQLVFVPENPAQEGLVTRESEQLRAQGVVPLEPEALRP